MKLLNGLLGGGILSILMAMHGAHAENEMPVSGVAAQQAEALDPDRVYVRVNGRPISFEEYNNDLLGLIKNRFYHGKVPDGQEEVLRKEVTDNLVDAMLLTEEAERRGIKPNLKVVEQAVADADAKYAGKPEWQQRDKLLPKLRDLVGRQSMIAQLRVAVMKELPEATEDVVRAYYEGHQDLFTEPEKLRLSVILFKVDPSAPVSAWGEAYDDAIEIVNRIRDGADFAEMARQYSGDKTASQGGDMGYLHRGMVPSLIQDGVDKFKVGEVSKPYKGLEGFSIFRLEDRIPPHLMEFERVKERAHDLLVRDTWLKAWDSLLDRLRKEAKIEIMEKFSDFKPDAVNKQ